jgi:Cu/Ag efflux protein CusF
MRLYRVILLVNLAVGVGFLLGSLWWGPEVWRLRRELAFSRQRAVAHPSTQESWSARGVVRVLAPEINRLFIEHEDIPGLMQAMTMAFEPEDPKLFDGLAPGDHVTFSLRKNGERLLLVAIEKGWKP